MFYCIFLLLSDNIGILLMDHRANTFIREHFDQNGMGDTSVNHKSLLHTSVYSISAATDFGDHAAGNDTVLDLSLIHILFCSRESFDTRPVCWR